MNNEPTPGAAAPRSKDEVALDLMKFVAVTTGYGKGAPSAGFAGKGARNPEEYADALLDLFVRCRGIIHSDPKA